MDRGQRSENPFQKKVLERNEGTQDVVTQLKNPQTAGSVEMVERLSRNEVSGGRGSMTNLDFPSP